MNTDKVKKDTIFFVSGMNKACQDAAVTYAENLYLDGTNRYLAVLEGVRLARRWKNQGIGKQRVYRKDNELIKAVMNNIEIEERNKQQYNNWFNTFYQSDFPVKWGV